MESIPQTFNDKPLVYAWTYRDQEGEALGMVGRYQNGADKDVVPYFKRNGSRWKAGAPYEPRPLYGLDVLNKAEPSRAVLVVEGEKCAAALHSLGFVAVTSLGGSKAADKTDWKPLEGRKPVYLLPDNDSPGQGYMRAVAGFLAALDSPPELSVIELPGLPDAGDVVDWIQAHLPDWNGLDPVPEREPLASEFMRAVKEYAKPVSEYWIKQEDEWPDIILLPERGDMGEAQPYRLDLLPSAIQKAAGEVSRFSMVPEASPAVIGLSVLAAAVGKKAVIIERNGLEHYPALFFSLIACSGERKSPAFKKMAYPLQQWAEDQQADYEDRARIAKARNAAVDNEISTVKGKAKKDGSGIDFVTDELSRLEAERIQPPPFPSLFTTDTTEQRLFQKMHDRDGDYAVMSGEGRPVLDAIMGKYSGDGRTGDAVYLAGISGDTITRDRVGGDNGPEEKVITRPCLNVCVMVQQGKYMETASVPALRDSGALARIWPVWLPAKAGTRIEQEGDKGLNTGLLKSFNSMVRDVLDHQMGEQGKPHKVRLSPEAVKARREFHNYIERLMAEGEDLEDVRDIASKAVSQTCKLALVLHIAENHSVLKSPESTISANTWAVAQTLGTYHLTEAVRVQRLADEDSSLEAARRVVRWIKKERLAQITTTLLTQQGPRPRLKATPAKAVLDILEEHGYLKARRTPEKRKPVYDVNPALFSQSSQFSRG